MSATLRSLLLPAVLVSIEGRAAPPWNPVPNEADANTLHLWHFDEKDTPFEDSAQPPTPLLGLHNGAVAGLPSLPGLGSAISFRMDSTISESSEINGPILTAAPLLALGGDDNVAADFRYFGPDGAFTYEMIVKLDILPADAPVIALGLFSMDGDGSDRIFNCRIEKQGFLSFIPLQHSGASGGAIATIPTSGPHAIDTSSWFHIAFTYDGNAGVTNNLKLYWTKLGPAVTRANRIGSGILSHDLNGLTADLAIGNEARTFDKNGEAEPFPGLIDEVRVSDIARQPSDYFFVSKTDRNEMEGIGEPAVKPRQTPNPDLSLAGIFVDTLPAELPPPGATFELGSGLHRLDFDFGFNPESINGAVKLRCQLEGIDERWKETELGMSLSCQILDAGERVLSSFRFPAIGQSNAWQTGLEDSIPTQRLEPIYIPANADSIRISLSSGSADTTGFMTAGDFALRIPGFPESNYWENDDSAERRVINSPAQAPSGWKRLGSDPAIARMIFHGERSVLGLVDSDQANYGEWTTLQRLDPALKPETTCLLSWTEAFNVFGSSLHRATYINVPPGTYMFRAIGVAENAAAAVASISLPILINPPVWEQLWFWPVVATLIAALVSAMILHQIRQRADSRMDRLQYQNALEIDRTRIARDMHDDLGTRITVINMTASLAQRDMSIAPEKARRHLSKMTQSARDLVIAMDDLVWAVDPAHDTLDDLAAHLTRLADEMFRDSPVRCRLDIPPVLPALPLGSEFRHNVALAAKESLHNVLQHAGSCEVFFKFTYAYDRITITIRDTGTGFNSTRSSRGHGLDNLARRFKEIGGCCDINSVPGTGTTVILSCCLPERPR